MIDKIIIIIAIIAILATFVMTVKSANETGFKYGYIKACKDFYSGKLKADLIEYEDGTKQWEITGDIYEE